MPAAFAWSVALSALLTALQLAVGLLSGSLALVGQALHKLIDVAALLLGWGAERLSLLPPTSRFTWGYGRATHLAAVVNAALVLAVGVVVVREAIGRLSTPVTVEPTPVILAALAGIAVNLVAAWLFGPEHRNDLNRRAAVVHLLTDAAVMGAVLVSAVLVHVTGRSVLDAATAIGVGLVVAWNGLRLLAQALAASLDGVPAGVDLAAVEEALASMPEVAAVQELHVWGLSTARTALAARLRLRSVEEERTAAAVRAAARQRLAELGIGCSILELEPAP